MRFIHAADIHLDSPLRGLEAYDGAPVERLRIATRDAFSRVVDACLSERVDFLILAGDLFDSDVRDFNAALAAAAELRRLAAANIPVYLILGNHDSRAETTRHAPWPANVTVFDHVRPQTVLHPSLPVALHGMSYPKREVTDNLVPQYPAPCAGRFNIGLLHSNVGGNTTHASYAPCTVAELVQKGYDYWAMGHVHGHAVLHERPHVVYAGNTQGRHARETGAKGCVLATVDERADGGDLEQPLSFIETDVVRWYRETIELKPDDDEDALLEATRKRLQEIVAATSGRLAAIRLEYAGHCAAHAKLTSNLSRQQLEADLRALAAEVSEDVWIERIKFRTQSPLDLDGLRERRDLIGQLLRDIDSLAADPRPLLSIPEAKDIVEKAAAELAASGDDECWDMNDAARQVVWLRDAEAILLGHLVCDNEGRS